eukprot:gene6607-9074_t
MSVNYYTIGAIGLTNLLALTLITIWRTSLFINANSTEDFESFPFKKKLIFHACLILTTVSDIPMYCGFIATGNYTLESYSFHKFETAFLFAAFSITIHDWSAVLYQIHEYKLYHFLFGRATLISVNVIYAMISIINFIFCYALADLDVYLSSPVYLIGIFFQLGTSLLLTGFMLAAGLKLSLRIQGAAGELNNNHIAVRQNSLATKNNSEFKSALLTLNSVMATCTACIFLQVILLSLNYGLGYASRTNAYVGPVFFYWTCYFWLPLWGTILSLLYLSRAHSKRKLDPNPNKIAMGIATANDNPLIESYDSRPGSFIETHNTLNADLMTNQLPHGGKIWNQFMAGTSPPSQMINERMNDRSTSGEMYSSASDTGHSNEDIYSPDNSMNYGFKDQRDVSRDTTGSRPSDMYFKEVRGVAGGFAEDSYNVNFES